MALMPPDQASAEPPGWETIEELFAALESPLLSYALRLAADAGVAEDIVQEAFMRLHAQFDEVREPRRWLYRTVHNLALNHRRQAGKIVPLSLPGDDGAPRGQRSRRSPAAARRANRPLGRHRPGPPQPGDPRRPQPRAGPAQVQ